MALSQSISSYCTHLFSELLVGFCTQMIDILEQFLFCDVFDNTDTSVNL